MQKIAFRYGLKMFLSLVILFVVIHFLGLSQNQNLRVLNGFVHLTFLFLSIRAYRVAYPKSVNNYVSGVVQGFYMSLIAVILFSFCMMIFLWVDTTFFNLLKQDFPYPEVFTPFTASLGIVVEGVAMSVIGSYIVTRFIDSLLEGAKT